MSVPLRIAAVSAAVSVVGVMSCLPASADSADPGSVKVVNTETVQVYTDAVGAIQTRRIYEQLALSGKGTVDVRNPIETNGLRNLDGFGGFEVKGGEQVANLTVDGEKRLRTVSDYPGKLPLDVKVRYFLDGKPVEPGDVVGKAGKLEVKYTVKNVTAVPQDVTFDDGKGGTVTRTVDVPIPMVGSLTVVAPPNFTDVSSGEANMAGDGKGGTKMSFTMTLFPPIGSDTAEFGYTANITNGVIPRASITALPVNPLESPSFKAAGESYKGGADTGIELTDGATQIDENLLKLRDGAGELLAGLIKLRDGAVKLDAGLSGVAAPGAKRLADGAGDLRDGVLRIDGGARQLADGSGQLRAGVGQLGRGAHKLDKGAAQLADGGRQLAGGTKKLAKGTGDLADGTRDALAGSRKLAAGAGQLNAGVGELGTGAGRLDVGAAQLAAGQSALADGLTELYKGIELMPAGVREELKTNVDYQTLLGTLDAVVAGIGQPTDASQETLLGGLNLLKYGLRSPVGKEDCDQAGTTSTPADDCGAADGAEIISEKLLEGVGQIDSTLLPASLGAYDALVALAGCPTRDGSDLAPFPPKSVLGLPDGNPCKAAAVAAFGYGLPAGALPGTPFSDGGLKDQATLASEKLAAIYDGLDKKAIPGIEGLKKALYNSNCNPMQKDKTAADFCGVSQALTLVRAGVPTLVDALTANLQQQLLEALGQPTKDCDPKGTLRCAAAALADGGSELSQGMTALVAGVGKLNEGSLALSGGAGDLAAGLGLINAGAGKLDSGANELKDGAGRLSAGANKLADGTGRLAAGSDDLVAGAGRLADGAGQLADGTGQAAAGSSQLADGAKQLSDGLGDAADGSGQIADGLDKAAAGAPKLRDGAQQLSDEGTSKLVEAGKATAQNYGEMYAVIEAGAQRADAEKMVYGAPKGAVGLAAYSYEIKGEDGEGGRNMTRGLGGLAVLAAGAGAFALRRRFV
jgi:putative membrane protein